MQGARCKRSAMSKVLDQALLLQELRDRVA
jgi:hypothetical protein